MMSFNEFCLKGWKLANYFLLNPFTPWFFLGMATEAIGISVQSKIGLPVIVDLDWVVGIGIAILIFHYQGTIFPEEDEDVESQDSSDQGPD